MLVEAGVPEVVHLRGACADEGMGFLDPESGTTGRPCHWEGSRFFGSSAQEATSAEGLEVSNRVAPESHPTQGALPPLGKPLATQKDPPMQGQEV